MKALFRQFSFPGGIPSHAAPETPGSIHEGGELGYALSHAYGAAFDNPDLLVACVIGDGEAETGPLSGVVAGEQVPPPGQRRHRAADPAPQRLQDRQLDGDGPDPRGGAARPAGGATATGRTSSRAVDEDPMAVHQRMAATLDEIVAEIARIQRHARAVRRRGAGRPAPLARARPAHPEGLDRAARGGRQARRGHVARAPGAAVRDPRQRRTPRPARAVAPLVPAGGAVRRRGPADPRAARAQPARRPSG